MAWATLSDVHCYYELLGDGEPLLLIPGLGTTCRLWDPVAPALADRFSLILPDNRGVGRSVATRHAHTLCDYVVDLVELLDELQLDRVHVLGLSLGGMIAQRLAIDHPSRVDRLVLVSCAHRFGPYLRGMAMLLAQAMRRFPVELYAQTVELLGTAPAYFDAHQDEIRQKIASISTCGVSRAAVVRQLQCLDRCETTAEEFRVEAPTFVIAGEYDAIIPSVYAKRMADAIPGSKFWIVPGGGHNPLAEFPDLVVPQIVEFIGRPQRDRRGMRNANIKEAPTSREGVGLIG